VPKIFWVREAKIDQGYRRAESIDEALKFLKDAKALRLDGRVVFHGLAPTEQDSLRAIGARRT
jgi:hypothetical protein